MLGSVFLGFPQMQDVVSSLTSAVLQVSQRTCCLRVPSSHQHFMTKWQTPEALQAYKNRLSWWNWLASGLGRKENELLYPGYSESSSSGCLFPARCCTPATRLRANLGFACCCCPHPAVARNTFLPAPCCVSSPSVLLFFTCMSPPSENPPESHATAATAAASRFCCTSHLYDYYCLLNCCLPHCTLRLKSVTLTCAMAIPSECWWNKLSVGKPIKQTRIRYSLYFVILID